jgi:hypothetical protein
MPLFSRPRSAAEIVRNLKEALTTLERGGDTKKQEKVQKTKRHFLIRMIIRRHNSVDDVPKDPSEIARDAFLQV